MLGFFVSFFDTVRLLKLLTAFLDDKSLCVHDFIAMNHRYWLSTRYAKFARHIKFANLIWDNEAQRERM